MNDAVGVNDPVQPIPDPEVTHCPAGASALPATTHCMPSEGQRGGRRGSAVTAGSTSAVPSKPSSSLHAAKSVLRSRLSVVHGGMIHAGKYEHLPGALKGDTDPRLLELLDGVASSSCVTALWCLELLCTGPLLCFFPHSSLF